MFRKINEKIRIRIGNIFKKGLEYLYELLRKKDYLVSQKIHHKDKHRFFRALEVKLELVRALIIGEKKMLQKILIIIFL